MMIQGIRSFGPEQGQTIQFNAPLTLIVGWNGSGKTTIIESLRFATTGELPSMSKSGGNFLHDPKLRNERELMAQVKLSFRSTSGVRMVATRNMMVSVNKKNARSQKTLEGSLLMIKDGEKHSISTRVAELNDIIPQYLGTPKAILDNVIFCHQEESAWPLAAPADLKKKFDEIFEAQKYSNAVDNIKRMRKARTAELGQLKIIESNAKEDRDRAKKSEDRQAKIYDEIEKLREDYEKIDAECTNAQQQAKEAYNHAARYQQIVSQLEGKRITFNAYQENVVSLEHNLKHMAEPDEELESMLNQYESRVATYASQNEELVKEYRAFKADVDKHRDSMGTKQSEIGKYEAQQEQYERNVQHRESLIREAAKRHGIRGFEYDITDKQIQDFQQMLNKLSRDQNKALERAREESQRELRDAQEALNSLNTRKSGLSQSKDAARQQITANDKRILDLQKSMNSIQADEGGEVILQEKKQRVEQQLRDATASASSDRLDERVQEVANEVRVLEDQKERLSNELGEATKQAKESAAVDYAQKELKSQQHSLETMRKVHNKRIAQHIDQDWEPATLERTYEQTLSEKTSKVQEATSRRNIVQAKVDKIMFQLSSLESDQKQKQKELKLCEGAVKEAIGKDDISDFEETLQQLEADYEAISSDNAKFSAQVDYMRSCLKVAERDNVCRLCMRALHDDRSQDFTVAGFRAKLEDIIQKAERNMKADNPDEILAELEVVRNAKPKYDIIIRLRDTELPKLKSEVAKLTTEREALDKQLEDHDAIIQELEEAKQEVESMSKDVQTIVGYFNKTRDLEAQVKELSQSQKVAGLSRGIDAVQTDLKRVTDDSRAARARLDQLSADREKARNLITSLELSIRDINAELNSAQSKLKEKRALNERVEEFKSENNKQRENMRGFDKSIEDLIPEIEQSQYQYDDVNRRGNERVQRVQDEASKLSDSLRQLNQSEQEINAYIERGGPEQLSRTLREIENLQHDISKLETEMNDVTRQIKKMEDTMRDTDMTKRSIDDNLRYRKAKRALETLQVEIAELEEHGAERDKEHFESEAARWDFQYHDLNTQKTGLERDMKNKDDQLTDLMAEYESIYKNAATQYREAHIKTETNKAVIEDLGRYASALDKAIMKYHTLKMEEINRIIAELWRNAYQGTDVDTIRIVSDADGAGNKVYNYRVVMVKQDTEMDMRGRCSAGQKVLACLIIRLALAECFGTNCGLIALDEPTTNLDQQNIKGLAESLSQIIQIRRKQANFQLLIITHDEAFLRAMDCADYTDVYWRVGRDENQESYIERQHISEVS